jgi:hypothetical protein
MGDIVSGIFGGGGGGGGQAPASQVTNNTVVQKQQSPLLGPLMSMAQQGGQLPASSFQGYTPFASFGQQLLQAAPQVGTPSANQMAANVVGQTIGRWNQQEHMGLPQ